jgi:FtsP/CotA-like multicopper oxidase with cupredoxin domain
VHKAQPVTFDLDKRSITILNVLDHGVLLGGAERADVLIDFSKYAGKTLILYNDAPTPMPAVDQRTDYFTGMGDMTNAGGAYDPLAGYGPNTRTIMQIKVANVAPAAALDLTQLANTLPVAYAKTQPAPHVPQKVYNAPFSTASADNYAQIITGGSSQPYFLMQGTTFAVTGATVVNGGSGYTSPPLVTFTPPPTPGVAATATAVLTNGVVTGFTAFSPGSGYDNKTPLTVTIAAPPAGGTRATAKIEVNALKVINKAIQELFDPIYGRMNATLAVELPFTSQANATTIPLAYVDTPVESLDAISDGETQIWKITHNGVDSHPIHFHLMNVQLINRVDWAGVIKPPQAGEMGWKETITMSPLEDVYVAAKAVRPAAPFGLPTSRRLLDPSQALGSKLMFTNLDPVTGQTPNFQRQLVNGINQDVPLATGEYSNQMTDYDNEYVWHCHILGHEENDFMRPMIFHPTVIVPDAPVMTSVAGGKVIWTDPTPFGGWDKDGIPTAGAFAKNVTTAAIIVGGVSYAPGEIYPVEPTNNPKNEIGFKVTRTLTATTSTGSTDTFTIAMVPANAVSWTDTEVVPTTLGTTYAVSYSVVAYNSLGNSVAGVSPGQAAVAGYVAPTSTVPAPGAALAPTGLTQTFTPATGTAPATTTLSWNAVAGATGYTVTGATCTMLTATSTSCTIAGAAGQTVTVAAIVNGITGAATSTFNGGALAPVGLTSSNGATGALQPGSLTLTWANNPLNVNNVTGLTLTWNLRGTAVVSTQTFAPSSTGVTLVGLSPDKDYNISLLANGVIGNSAAVTKMVLSAP